MCPTLRPNYRRRWDEIFFHCFTTDHSTGKLIEEEVKTHNDALLLLWRVHNKANQRLAGDISEDPVFPKLIFPSKEFCSSCYDGTVTGNLGSLEGLSLIFISGTNLWVEFNKNSVLQFLKNMYSKEKLSSQAS